MILADYEYYPFHEAEKPEEEKKKKRKVKKEMITIHSVDEAEKLKKSKKFRELGKTVLLIKTPEGKLEHEVFSQDRWRALERAIELKKSNQQLKVRLVLY